MRKEEWGPWIEHDGKGCPCLGMWVHCVFMMRSGDTSELQGIAGALGGRSWDWKNKGFAARIIRYRIRRPRGMEVLDQILADLPKVKEGEVA